MRLPAKALRLFDERVPGEVTQVLKHLIEAAGENARQGNSEVLAWTEEEFTQSSVAVRMSALVTALKKAGRTYEAAGTDNDLTIFSVVRSEPAKRALLGFHTASDAALVLAWTEVIFVALLASDASTTPAKPVERIETRPTPYVKDIAGNPIEGATLGVRATAMGGSYSGAQGETNAEGDYEFAVLAGVAHFYNAGCAIEWGDGLAAVGLHAADGKLGTFATPDGVVENFVLLPYGITSRENVSESPRLAATCYGGSIYVGYWTREANDAYALANNIAEGPVIEISLTPEGDMVGGIAPQRFLVRKPAFSTGFRINNLPLGQYRIRATLAGGGPLKMMLRKPRGTVFGMKPEETTDGALVLFAPDGARASMVVPNYGSWTPVEIGWGFHGIRLQRAAT